MTDVARASEGAAVRIPAGGAVLDGDLVRGDSGAVVVFAHGSGSSRLSPRNRHVARGLRELGLGTLLFDLLTPEEEEAERFTRHLRFDIPLLSRRLVDVTRWLRGVDPEVCVGFFGASTGAAAALVAATDLGHVVGCIVSRGGRPDLAGDALSLVMAPTLLIVGGDDTDVLRLNEQALAQLRCEKRLAVVPGATHLFEEPGALEEVERLAGAWLAEHLLRRQ